jgi:hypothetical protein
MERLRDDHGAEVAQSTVRGYVRRRRRELGLTAQAYCPQVHDVGVTAEVDWGEATVMIAGVLVTVRLFLMRSCFSGACFVMPFETQTQQALFDGQVAAFDFFSGVFGTCRYDNLTENREEDAERPPAGRERAVRRAALAFICTRRGSRWWGSRGPMRKEKIERFFRTKRTQTVFP